MHEYASMRGLQVHSASHLRKESFFELQQLREGKLPAFNKIGGEFRGKNRIIIS
jgi:hypothetical protein